MKKIGIIGYGSIGKMIFSKIIESKKIHESDIFLSTILYDEIAGLKTVYPKLNISKDNKDTAKNADILFLCLRALEIKQVLREIIADVKSDCHIVSLNACVLFRQIEQICPDKKISKITPNINGEINHSITLVAHNDYVRDDDKNELKKLLECFGTTVEMPETEIGAGMELTSCMPGYIGAMLKIVVDEAEKHTSMRRSELVKMLLGTVYGTAKFLLEKEISFEELVTRVATKGGITEEGKKVLDAKMPEIAGKMFEKTNEKRRITTESVQKDFGG